MTGPPAGSQAAQDGCREQRTHAVRIEEEEEKSGTFLMLSCKSGCGGRAEPTSSRVSMADPGVVAAVLTVVLGAVPDELTESISPATSWISRAKMAKSLARSWLILRTHGNNLSTIRQKDRQMEGGKEEVFRAWNHATCAYKTLLCLKLTDVQRSAPCYLLAVGRPVPDVLVLLLHAVFHPDAAARAAHGAAT